MSELQPYDSLIQRGPNIWTLDGEWYKTSFRRRMTVIRIGVDQLVVHSAIQLKPEDYAQIDALGHVRWIVAPNAFHSDEAPVYKARYPDAKLLVPPSVFKKFRKKGVEVDGSLDNLKEFPGGELICKAVDGLKLLEEYVLYHSISKTLILTDLMFNMTSPKSWIERSFFRWNQIDNRFGMSRIFRLMFVRDKTLVLKNLDEIAQWDFDLVIVNHGNIVETSGKKGFIAGYTTLK